MSNDLLERPDAGAPAASGASDRWLAALLAWDAERAQLPDTPQTYQAAVARLKQTGRHELADRVMDEAVRRFADNAALAIEHARAAELRKDWQTALARWQQVSASFPRNPLGHWHTGVILRKELGRLDAAEAVLETAMAMFPNQVEIWTEHALTAVDRKDKPLAIQRYQTIRERFPAFPGGYRWGAGLLRDQRRLDEAEAVLADGLVRFPDNQDLLVDHAWLASLRHDWEAVVARWEAVRAAHPDNRAAYWRAGETLVVLGRLDEAEDLLAAGMARFPDHVEMEIEHARVAEKRGDWTEAHARWQVLLERFPGNVKVVNLAGRTRTLAQLSMVDGADAADAPAIASPVSPDTAAPYRELVMQFESIGTNCEFGIVQRRCRAEPLGLLRWAGLQCQALRAALENRLEGIGEPEYTRVSIDPKSREYFIHEDRYGMIVHTFKLAHELAEEQEQFLKQMCRRLQYLRRKFLQDLAVGEKIFVLKHNNGVPDSDLLAIRDALAGYGPNTLLHVRTSDAEHPPGLVEQTGPGLLIGYIDRFVAANAPWDSDLSLDVWLSIARKAYALWKPPGPHASGLLA